MRPFGYGLAKILPVVVDVKFIIFDGAMVRFILPWQIGEAFDDGGRKQFEDDFVGKAGAVVVPLGIPKGVGVAVHGIFSVTVLASGFLAVHFDELEFDFSHPGSFLGLNTTVVPGNSGTAQQTAAQHKREAEEEFGFHGLLVAKKVNEHTLNQFILCITSLGRHGSPHDRIVICCRQTICKNASHGFVSGIDIYFGNIISGQTTTAAAARARIFQTRANVSGFFCYDWQQTAN